MSKNQDLIAKIRWDCRRGMLELDYILEHFISNGLDNLPEPELREVITFLENQDPDLFSWFLGYRQPSLELDIKWLERILACQPQHH